MPNIHGLHDNDAKAPDNEKDDDESDRRYVGGVDARGGGSGLAVLPNPDDKSKADSIFNLAEIPGSGGADGGGEEVRRTITMYAGGFTVDDGPYRRLDDPTNAEFLTSLARGLVPRELSQEARDSGGGEVVVGLIDKRGEEYDPANRPRGGNGGFESFSGQGQSLGGQGGGAAAVVTASPEGVIDPANAGAPRELDASRPTTSVAVRLLNGKRLVVKVNLDSPLTEVGHHIGSQAGTDPYVLTSGFPPATITDLGKSVEEAGLKGAQIVLKKA